MAKLILNPTSPARRDFPLPRTVLSIGRDPSNDLVLADAMVSRRHALIECRGNHYFLRDCNSSNGSLVNGDRVSERGLRDGDLVAIGTVRLMFREEAALSEPGAKVVQHPSAPRLVCPACQADYRKGDLFCRQCGGRVEELPPRVVCTSCGTAVLLPAHFCNACGTPLVKPESTAGADAVATEEPAGEAAPAPADPQPPVGELRLREREAADAEPAGDVAVGDDRRTAEHPAMVPDEAVAPSASSGGAARAAAVMSVPAPPLPERATRPPVPALRAVPVRPAREPREPAAPDLMHQTTRGVEARPPASPGPRLLAALVDGALVSAGLLVLLAPVAFYFRRAAADAAGPGFLAILGSVSLGLVALLLAAGYYIYFWGLRGATPGKRLMGLRVYGLDGRFPVGFQRALLRLLGYLLSAAALGLGFVVILFGATSLHDRVARTVVVRERAR